MALLTMFVAMIGFGIAKGLHYFLKHRRKAILIENFPYYLLAKNLDDIYIKEDADAKKKVR